jgi:hypothetical protein
MTACVAGAAIKPTKIKPNQGFHCSEMSRVQHQYFLVGIETDPTRYHGEHPGRPALLDKVAAEQVLAHIATDLASLLPAISRCALSMAGALFDQTQILRPQFPVLKALQDLQQSSNPGSDFQSRLLSIGSDQGQMPVAELQPLADIPLGLLQILPLLLSGPADLIEELNEEMEHRFLDQGQLSAHSAKSLESQFLVSINHARFMTLTDLNAMLRMQLDHFGFLPLWELLDAAINTPDRILEANSTDGHQFKWQDGAVHSVFETFDWWATHGGGVDLPAEDQQLQTAYVDWTRIYRQYLTLLNAHGIDVLQFLPGLGDVPISDTFLLEESTVSPGQSVATVTEHNVADLGIVALTVTQGARQMNFYPLQASGLNDLHQYVQQQGFGGDVAFPGKLCYDETSRQLIAESMAGR